MARVLFIIGGAGLIACIYWWATFYTAFIEVAGLKTTTKDWSEAIQIYGQCLFWDTERCLSAKGDPKMQDWTPYRPHFIWLAFGMLVAGAIIRIKETLGASAGDRNSRS
jgi:hypothetical protein